MSAAAGDQDGPQTARQGKASALGRLLRGSMTYGASDLLQRALGFLLLPLYTRLLTPAEYGTIAVMTAFGALMTPIFGLGLRSAVVREYYDHRDDPAELRAYLSTVGMTLLGIGAILLSALWLAGPALLAPLFEGTSFFPYLALTLVWSLTGALSGVLLSLYRAREQAHRYGVFNIVHFLTTTAAIFFFVAIERRGAYGWILGQLASGLAMAAFVGYALFRGSGFQWRPTLARSALAYGLPLVPHMLAGTLLNIVDRLILQNTVSKTDLGLYSFGYQFGMIVGFLAAAINSAWTPIFFDLAKKDPNAKQDFAAIMDPYVAFMTLLAAGVGLFATEAIDIIAPASYHPAARIVPVVATAYFIQGLYFMVSTPIFMARKTSILPWLTATSAGIQVVVILALVPRIGVVAAAYATLASYLFLAGGAFFLAQRLYKIPYGRVTLIVPALLLLTIPLVLEATEGLSFAVAVAWKAGVMIALAGALVVLGIARVDSFRALRLAGGPRK